MLTSQGMLEMGLCWNCHGESAFWPSAGQAPNNRHHPVLASLHLNLRPTSCACRAPPAGHAHLHVASGGMRVPASCRFTELTLPILQVSGEALSFKQAAQAFREVKGEIKVQLLSYASAHDP